MTTYIAGSQRIGIISLPKMNIRVGSFLILLFNMAVLVAATGRAGAYERIYLWCAYNLLMDDDPCQNVILGFGTRKGLDWRNNKGSGPGKRLTFQEFMERFDNRDRGNCQIQPPGEGHSIHQVAAEMDKAGYDNTINVRILTGKESGRDKYGDYLMEVTQAVARARANGDKGESCSINGNKYRQWDYVDYVDKMRQSAAATSEIRKWEFNGKYIKWAVSEVFNLWKEPVSKSVLKDDRPFIDGVVLEEPANSQYKQDKNLTAMNLEETLKSSAVQDKIKAVIECPNNWQSHLHSWISCCGMVNKEGHCKPDGFPLYPNFTLGHREVLDAVEKVVKLIGKDAEC